MVAFRFFLILRCFVVNRENNKIQAHAQFQRKQSPQLTVLILMVLNSVLEHPLYTYTKKSFFLKSVDKQRFQIRCFLSNKEVNNFDFWCILFCFEIVH